jgi:hypothetical protein
MFVVLKSFSTIEQLTTQRHALTEQLSNATFRHRALKTEKDAPTHLDKEKFKAVLLLRKTIQFEEWNELDKYMRCGINYVRLGNLRDDLIGKREVVVEAIEMLEEEQRRPALARVDSLSEDESGSQ